MSKRAVNVVLLSGGSGTHLWPLSNAVRSKQFLKVLRDDTGTPESMVQRTVRLVRSQNPQATITVATSASQLDFLSAQIGDGYKVSVEPERRDTAPAIMLAAAHVAWAQGASPNSTVVVMPIDTYADPSYYDNIAVLDETVRAGCAELVLLGVKPTYPSQKFGYILPVRASGGDSASPLIVERFVEKPNKELATQLIAKGALWNCGVFACKLSYLLDLLEKYSDAKTYDELVEQYARLPKNSFDYEVVEKAASVAVVPYEGAWKDLGTWNALAEELVEPVAGKVCLDEETTSNVHVINETDLPIVVAGIHDAVIVATPDGILVTSKQASARIKDMVSMQ
ncbi:MAG: sugar phosphate nucleotidyltransferase [Coriobacteriales bacterium]|nr:sugar phosphate nucleotidyltransferase [Coriobacteriales bacterium]